MRRTRSVYERRTRAAYVPVALVAAVVLVLLLLPVAMYSINVWHGLGVASQSRGSIVANGLNAPVEIVRDTRFIPHVRARNLHDLFFAEGFLQGSDRLAQMDAQRHLVYGRLAEVLGSPALPIDLQVRVVDVPGMVAREWASMPASERELFTAYSDGVNLAMKTQPTPVEFRILMYRPEPWKPQDSLAVAFATVSDLTDSWNDLLSRDEVWRRYGERGYGVLFPLSDPRYDVPIVHVKQGNGVGTNASYLPAGKTNGVGSNNWAAGAARTTTGRALLANDPHLGLGIPGAWYLVDLQAPGFHVAGASLPGIPGVILGHNDHIAWGATNGVATAISVFAAPTQGRLPLRPDPQTFHVRFARDTTHTYYRSATEFAVPLPKGSLAEYGIVRWPMYSGHESPINTFLALDAAPSIAGALHALSQYPGPTQNFVVADDTGAAAYHLAGLIPNDPAWARYVHPFADRAKNYAPVPFERLPHVNGSRDAVVFSANNKMYGPGYPYRLSAAFVSPYRAYRIHQLLHERKTYSVDYFAGMQLDTFAPVDDQLARDIVTQARQHPERVAKGAVPFVDALASWNGRYDPSSTAAAVARAMRSADDRLHDEAQHEALRNGSFIPDPVDPLNVLAQGVSALGTGDEPLRPWSEIGAVQIHHALSRVNFHVLDGARLPGNGWSDTIHVQTDGVNQSFRAVWDIGNWDAGGIVIANGESGQPGSGHYTDQTPTWISGKLVPLPYSKAAVDAAARERLMLLPGRVSSQPMSSRLSPQTLGVRRSAAPSSKREGEFGRSSSREGTGSFHA